MKHGENLEAMESYRNIDRATSPQLGCEGIYQMFIRRCAFLSQALTIMPIKRFSGGQDVSYFFRYAYKLRCTKPAHAWQYKALAT